MSEDAHAAREEIVRRALDAFAARDLPALIELADPGIELRPLVSVWQRSYLGVEGREEWYGEVSRIWDEFTVDSEEVRDLGSDTMLVKGHWHGQPVQGGSEVGGPIVGVLHFRDGKIAVADFFLTEEAALASLESG